MHTFSKKSDGQKQYHNATSTPNEWIQGLAEKYEIPLYINTGEGGIAQDWNLHTDRQKQNYVTIAHQE